MDAAQMKKERQRVNSVKYRQANREAVRERDRQRKRLANATAMTEMMENTPTTAEASEMDAPAMTEMMENTPTTAEASEMDAPAMTEMMEIAAIEATPYNPPRTKGKVYGGR